MDEQFTQIVDSLKQKNTDTQARKASLTDQRATIASLDAVQRAVVQSIKVLMEALLTESLSVTVQNQPETIQTPDAITGADMVKAAVKSLEWTVANKETDFTPVVDQLQAVLQAVEKLPTEFPEDKEFPTELAINNLGPVVDEIKKLSEQVKGVELQPNITVTPADVTVEAPVVNVVLDEQFQRLEDLLQTLRPVDTTEEARLMHDRLVSQLQGVQEAVRSIIIPVPNIKPTFVDSTGKNVAVTVDNAGSVPVTSAVLTERYDYADPTTIYVGQAAPGTTDSSTAWTVFKYDLTDNGNASGKVATNIAWTSRTGGSYA